LVEPAPEPFLPEALEANLRDLAAALKSLEGQAKALRTAAGTWDFRRLRQRLPELLEALSAIEKLGERFRGELQRFGLQDFGPAVETYVRLLTAEAGRLGLDLAGEYPDFTAFPVELHVRLADEQVRIGKKTASTLEPHTVVQALQKEQARLHRSSFNAQRFMKSLVAAYDLLAPEREGRASASSVSLLKIHDVLTLRTGKADYSRQAFAFDIYRLRRTTDLVFEGKRQLQFEHGRRSTVDVPTGRGVDNLAALRIFPIQADA